MGCLEGTSIPITCQNQGHLWGQTSLLRVLSSPSFYTSVTESEWPLKCSELSGPGSPGAFRESFEREKGGLAAHAKSISMRNSDFGDIQGKLAAALRGE